MPSRPPLTLVEALRQTFRFPVIDRLWRFLVIVAGYSAAVALFEFVAESYFSVSPPTPRVAEVVLSTLLFGVLLQFRTNTSYDRWYEGRKLWGTLVNVSRNLVLKTSHVIRPGIDDEAEVRRLVVEFAVNLRHRLGDHEARPGHQPMLTAGQLYDVLEGWIKSGQVNTAQALLFDAELRQFMDVCGACERIRSTPLTASYRGLLRKGIGLFVIILPWLIVGDVGWFTVPITLIIAYVLIALELVADDIEDPFGYGPDDLKLDAIVEVIRTAAEAHPTGRWPVPGGVLPGRKAAGS